MPQNAPPMSRWYSSAYATPPWKTEYYFIISIGRCQKRRITRQYLCHRHNKVSWDTLTRRCGLPGDCFQQTVTYESAPAVPEALVWHTTCRGDYREATRPSSTDPGLTPRYTQRGSRMTAAA